MWRVVIGLGIGFAMGLFVEQALFVPPLHSQTCTVTQEMNKRPPFLPQRVLHCPPGVEYDVVWNEPEKVKP
jgi:hypothetical protein